MFVFIFVNTLSVFAGPGKTTYQAKIVKPDGYPLESTSVNFKFTILDPAGTCILYSETYSSVNMSSTGGLISFALGSGVKTYPASATTFEQVFSNITPSLSCDTGGPTDYSPAASDIRKIVMQFHDGSGWQTLPAMSINAVPYAMYANEATKLNGLTSSDFVQLTTVPTCAASEALRYTGAGFTCIAVGNSVTSGTVVTALGYTPADSVSLTAVTSDLSTVSSTVFSVSSTVTSLQNSVAASFAAITSSQWTTSGTNIFYNTGNIGIGTTTPVTTLDVSGGVRIGAESTTCAPALAGTLRYNASNVEYCNGTSWQAFGVSGSGITNFNGSTSGTQSFTTGTGGTAPNFNTLNGVHTLNIPLASTGSVTAGLLSNTDYTTFSNKITSSAASIAQVLGYIPADNAASGTYAQKANNLSDLTNVATARANLGLGTFATASSIDLGSASATGTLDIARLPSFTGDATIAAASNTIILSDSGVLAGTYTKVTVDAKGRVTSSSTLASSDVTTALGYTPANSATTVSSQWTTSGTNIFYNTGNVGIGTTAPTAKLHLTSGTTSVAPLKFTSGTLLTSPQSGTIEYDGTNFYLTDSTNTRRAIAANTNPGTYDNVSNINSSGNITMTPTGSVVVSSTTASTNSNTGALVVKGGLGVAGDIYASGTIVTSSNIQGVSVTATSGMISPYIAGSLVSGGSLTLDSTTHSTKGNILLAPNGGNVGIGITAPQQKLHLGEAGIFRIQDNDDTSPHGYLEFGVTTAGSWSRKGYIGMPGAGSAELAIAADGAGTPIYLKNTTGTVMTVSGSNVGIGTTTPTAKLDVAGQAWFGVTNKLKLQESGDALSLQGTLATDDNQKKSLLLNAWGGSVGIGTTAPNVLLDLAGGSNQAIIKELGVGSTVASYFYNVNDFTGMTMNRNPQTGTFTDITKTHVGINLFSAVGDSYIGFSTSAVNNTIATEKVRIDRNGNVGIGTTTPVTSLDVSGGVRISMETATCAVSFAGTLRYNASNVEYCNGTSWQAFGVSGAGLQSFNGSTSGTQSFTTGTGGTAPNFNTSNGVHTLNIPLASAGSVTAGLISNTDYTTFTNKITSSAASIAQVLGYVPADNAVSGTYAQKANNLSDLTNVATARTNLGLGTFATANTIDLGSASATGTLAIARLPSFTGDATVAAASNAIILSNSGVTAGTYTKVTVDNKGRVISSSALASSDVTTALGYTPANSATIVSSQWNTSGTTINYMNGNVGIGTSTPLSPLDVAVSDVSSGITLTNTNSTANRYPLIGVVNYAGGTTGHPVLSMFNAQGTAAAPAALNTGMNLGTLLWSAQVTASQTMQGARIDAISDGSFAANTAPTRLTFSVAPASGNYVQRMVINSAGNVGIGTTAPSAKLHLSAGTSVTAALKFTSGTLITAAQSGAMEYDGFNFYVTDSTNTRRTIATGSNSGTIDNASNINSSENITLTPTGSVVVSSTTTSTNSSTGALIVKGGLGVAENLNVAGTISGSAKVMATGFRANQGIPDNNDSSTNGYAFGTDGDTGMFSPGSGAANGVLTFYGNNSEVMRMTSGKVGIGTSAPASKLHVEGTTGDISGGVILRSTTGGNQFGFYTSLNDFHLRSVTAGADVLTATYAGNIGIGTSNPARKIHIKDQYPYMAFEDTENASGSVGTITYNQDANFYFDADNPSTGSDAGFRFRANGGTKNLLAITNSGNVGIGTTSPSYPLDVKNQMRIGAQGGSDVTLIAGGSGYGSQIYQYYADGVLKNVFSANGNSYINAGSFGIGTSAPTNVLHVKAPSTYATQTSQFAVGDSATDMKLNVGVGTDGTNKVSWVQSTEVSVSNDRNLALQPFGGNVGIGTTAPVNPFQTTMTSGAGNPYIGLNQTADNPYIELQRWTGSASNYEGVRLKNIVGSGGQFAIETTQNGGAAIGSQTFTERMRIAGDNVGIGTSSPYAKLEIYNGSQGNLTFPLMLSNNSGVNDSTSVGLSFNVGNSTSPKGGIFLNRNGGTYGQGDLQFALSSMADNSTAVVSSDTKMTIKNNGNVGIGTSSPSVPLEVNGDIVTTGGSTALSLKAGPTEDHTYMSFFARSASPSTRTGYFGFPGGGSVFLNIFNETATGPITLGTNGSEKMRIDSAGNVGIGTATPQSKLDVANATIRALDSATQYAPSGGRGLELLSLNGTGYIFPYDRTTLTYLPLRVDGSLVSIANGGTPVITVTGGNVGIGIASPGALLHVADFTGAGGKNLLVGDDSFLSDVDVSNTLGIYGNQDATQGHIRLGSSGPLISGYTGFVGIGNATPSYALDVSGDLRITGTPYRNGGDITWTVPSDARLKDVIRTYDRGLREIANLDMIIFKYKKDNPKQINSDKEYTGVIAQQVQEQIPEAVSVDKDGFLSLNTTPIFWAMINAIKELYNEVTGVSREVAAIKAENAELKKQNEAIKVYLCAKDPNASMCK